MDNDLFKRPTWISYLPYILLGSIIISLTGAALLTSGTLPREISFLAFLAAISPIFPLLSVIPVLNNEMRLVDSMRMGLLSQDLEEANKPTR